jgi:hypothetical protein
MDNARIKSKSLFIGTLLSADARVLIELAEQALAVRDYGTLTRIGTQLCTIPVGGYFEAGLLYTAIALNRIPGSQAAGILEQLSESSSPVIRARVMLTLGSNELQKGDSVEALRYYRKAASLNSTCPLFLRCSAMMTIAAFSLEGKHHECLDSLNRMSRLAGYVGRALPVYGFDYLNSVAVELNHCGHKEQARKIIGPVVASPYVSKYTEWQETAAEINQPLKAMTNVVQFPVSRPEQVRRMFAIAKDKSLDGNTLKRGVDVLHKEVYGATA